MAMVGLLHTSEAHRPVFDDLVAELDPTSRLVTVVDETLLHRARRFGPDDPTLVEATRKRLDELVDAGARSIVCTCSTIGGLAESIGADSAVDVVRVDRAMAERAAAIGGSIVVLAALESTVATTRDLIESVAVNRGARVAVEARLVVGAWERFEAGDLAGYHALVADAIRRVGDEADVVVLAQASMARAADLLTVETPVLSSPRSAMIAAFDSP